MNFIRAVFVGLGLAVATGLASAHDPATQNVTPPQLNNDTIVMRLKALGFSEVAIVQEREGAVDVEMQRDGRRFRLTVSRSLVGPRSLASYDTREFVEREMKPVDPRLRIERGPRIPPVLTPR